MGQDTLERGTYMDENRKIPNVGGSEAGYLFEFKEDGVYLTVYPHADGGILFELSDMRQILGEYGVKEYDMELLARVVRTADGVPYRLAEHFDAPSELPKDPNHIGAAATASDEIEEVMAYTVEISKDKMQATVKLDRQAGTRPPDLETILEALRARQVVYGIDEEAITEGLKFASEFVAAQGTPPEAGHDAEIKRHFSFQEKGKPSQMQYDKVDYKNLNLFVLARKGQVLAERIPHTTGVEGKTVLGQEVKPKSGKPKPLPTGKNTETKDENFLIASIDGQIVDAGNKISIDPQLSIKDDVGVATGDIDFVGAVEIGGSVQMGFKVKATGDIYIKGMVSGGVVEGCNVYVTGGIQGSNHGMISAEQDVRAAFAENATIEAGGSIFIEDVSLHSDLRAGRLIALEGKRGLVAGGYLAAGKEIRAKTVGNQAYTVTRLVVGVNPMLQRKYQETCRSYAAAKKKLAQLTKTLNTLGKVDMANLPPHRAAQISEMTRSQFPLAGQVERDEKLLRELEEQIAEMKDGYIRVADKMYPGTKLIINSVMKNIQTEEQHCTMAVVDEQIQAKPY